jgi:hypothetical protein
VRVDGQPVANLYLGMLAAAGVEATAFGADGTEPLVALVG